MKISAERTNAIFRRQDEAENAAFPENNKNLKERVNNSFQKIKDTMHANPNLADFIIDYFITGKKSDELFKEAEANEDEVLKNLGYDPAVIISGLKYCEQNGIGKFKE